MLLTICQTGSRCSDLRVHDWEGWGGLVILVSSADLLAGLAALGLDEEDYQEGAGDEDTQEDGEVGREGDGHTLGKWH